MKKGLLLINLGTPQQPETRFVRHYLRQFLADKRVITLPAPLRYLLLYGVILPFRAKKSAHAYQSIWRTDGSPLLVNCLGLQKKVQENLGDKYCVALGMRYGEPSIESALHQLSSCSEVTILPLYPQYSSAATGSSIEEALKHIAKMQIIPSLRIIRDFHNHPLFIDALSASIKPFLANHDHLLFSYHGLPEQHIIKGGCKTPCQTQCPSTSTTPSGCYRAQCLQTSQSVAHQLQLSPEKYDTSFQSRLGRTSWIKPYTDEILPKLAQKGIKRLAVVCPSFTADCLETLEEIGIQAKEQWHHLGGEQLSLIPCLNTTEAWVQAIPHIIRNAGA